MSKSPKTLIEYIPLYLIFCEKERLLLPLSIVSYRRFLSDFKMWLQQSNLQSLTPQNFTIDHIQQYQAFLSSRSIAQKTKNFYLISLRGLFLYLVEKGITTIIFPQQIKLAKTYQNKLLVTSSSVLDDSFIKKLIDAPDGSTLVGRRDKALLSILISNCLNYGII